MVRLSTNLAHWIVVLCSLFIITACGGGSKKSTPDTTPDALTFTAATNQERDITVTSNTLTIAGLGEGVAASLSVSGGQYSINSGAFASSATTISNGQTVTLRGQSSSDFGATTTVTLTIGSVSGNFSITTLARDDAPAAFTPTPQTGVGLSEEITFPAFTVSGINDQVAISISGTSVSYAINEGEFANSAGTVNEGDEVQVRVTASSEFSTAATATLTIGSVSGTFTVTTLARDDTPNGFTPTSAQTGVVISQDFTFPAFTVSGINDAVAISISGSNVAYAVNDGDFSSTAATVNEGDEVQVRVRASASFNTTNSAQLTIGSVTGAFSVVSEVEDTTPAAFSFSPATTNAASTWVESQAVTISGINSAAAVSITNGEYRIGTDAYTSTAGTLTNGQPVQVRVQSSAQADQAATATLSIGGVQASFTATTEDNTAPQASVVFPTPNTLSDGTTLTLRGRATDDFGPVESITLTVTTDDGATTVDTQTLTATEDDNFQTTWSQQVTLAQNKVNTISVVATDAAGNEQEEATVVTVTQSTTEINFPVGNGVYMGDLTTRQIDLDLENNRLLVPVFGGGVRILEVDLVTGQRSDFLPNANPFVSLFSVLTFPERDEFVFIDVNAGVIYKAGLIFPEYEVLSDSNTENSNIEVGIPRGAGRGIGDVFYVVASQNVYSVNFLTGARALVSGEAKPDDGGDLFVTPRDISIDILNNTGFITDSGANKIWAVDLDSGERNEVVVMGLSFPSQIEIDEDNRRALIVNRNLHQLLAMSLDDNSVEVVSDMAIPNSSNSLSYPAGLAIDKDSQIGFATSNLNLSSSISSIKVVDLTTGERVTLTYSKP